MPSEEEHKRKQLILFNADPWVAAAAARSLLAAAARDVGASAAVGVGLGAGAAVVVAGAAAVAGDGAPAERAVGDVAAVAPQEAAVRVGLGRPEPALRVVVFVAVLVEAGALGDGAPAILPAGGGEEAELHVVPAGDGGGGGGGGEREEEDQGEGPDAGHARRRRRGRE